jgi:predicted Holliday junction resolvase-like endonuclease
MTPKSKALIAELKHNKRFMGTCPQCNEEFRFSDALLFDIKSSLPDEVEEAIAMLRQGINDRKDKLKADRLRMTERAEKTSHAVNLGKIVEKIVPSFPAFSFSAGDCRALFEPIDYVVFSGLTSKGFVEALYLADVKSGGARLTLDQRSIKSAVEGGHLRFDTISTKRFPNDKPI